MADIEHRNTEPREISLGLSLLEKSLLERLLTNHLGESFHRLEQVEIQENPAWRLCWEGDLQDCKTVLAKVSKAWYEGGE